mgnify:CR=1 FL=1
MKLLFLGIPGMLIYEGFDNNRRPISCRKGDWVEVSQEKADRLLQDFPEAWRREDASPPPAPVTERSVEEVTPTTGQVIVPAPLEKKSGPRKKHGR